LVRECLSSSSSPSPPITSGNIGDLESSSTAEAASSLIAQARRLKEAVNKFTALRLDHTEYTCLKALVLFKPGMRMLLKLIEI
jgi:hypothetical protein